MTTVNGKPRTIETYLSPGDDEPVRNDPQPRFPDPAADRLKDRGEFKPRVNKNIQI